jgi:quercetin dioxygenase-like cupin family protein
VRRLASSASATNGQEQTVFATHDPEGYRTAAPGILMKTLCFGCETLMTEFRLRGGATLPAHAHPHEQTGYLVAGHIGLTIGAQTHDVGPGDSWCIPGGVQHAASILEDSVAVEVFSPVRQDYLPEGAQTG